MFQLHDAHPIRPSSRLRGKEPFDVVDLIDYENSVLGYIPCMPKPMERRLRRGHDHKSKARLREEDARRKRRSVCVQEPERRVRRRTRRTTLRVQIRCYGILYRWREAREEGE
jgi:hypothetical protein